MDRLTGWRTATNRLPSRRESRRDEEQRRRRLLHRGGEDLLDGERLDRVGGGHRGLAVILLDLDGAGALAAFVIARRFFRRRWHRGLTLPLTGAAGVAGLLNRLNDRLCNAKNDMQALDTALTEGELGRGDRYKEGEPHQGGEDAVNR